MTLGHTRRLAAVWFADIVGYTKLSAHDEDLALRVVRELQRIARIQCDARGGRVVKLVGDGILTVFDSADGAIRAAVKVRDEFLSSLEARHADVSLRIGIHVGDITEAQDGDVYGDAVNAASRIESVAEPGQILMSEVAYHLLQQHSSIEAETVGEHELMGIGTMRLYYAKSVEDAPVENLQDLLQDQLAPLQLLGKEGMGGMGAIYLARDPGLRRTLAVKVLRTELVADKQARARFQREAQVIAGLSHPNILGVHSVGELKDATPYFVMDYIEGGSLEDRLKSEGPLSVPEVRRILGEVASALAAAHERGVVHRDIKASNVLYDQDSGRCLVSDWGIAALDPTVELSPDTRLTKVGAVIGSPKYMSPEQLAGDEVGPESDVYSLGLLAFELLTGDGPFPDDTPRAIMIAHLREDAPSLASVREDVGLELETLISQCLSKNPDERPGADRIAQLLAPGAETRLEWPPPGLDGLLGKGRRVGMAALMGLGLVNLPTMGALLPILLPEFVAYELQVGSELLIVPMAVMLVGVVLTLVAVVEAVRAGIVWRHGVTLGYGWLTLAEVAADHRGDTGTLTTGGREYVALPSAERRRLRLLRLAAASAPFVAVLTLVAFAPLAPLLTSAGVSNVPLFAALFGPTIALVLAGALAESIELRKVRTMRHQLRQRRAPGRSLSRLVAPWYSSLEESTDAAPLGPGPTGRNWLGLTVLVGVVTLLGFGLSTALPVGVMSAVGPISAARNSIRFSGVQERVDRLQIGRAHRLAPDSSLDAIAAAELLYNLRPITDEAGDSTWRNRPTAAHVRGSPLVTGSAPLGICPADRERCSHDLITPDSALIAASRGLSAREREYLSTFAHNPRFPAFSALARATALDEWRMTEMVYGAPLISEGMTWWDVPIPKLSSMREIAYLKIGHAASQYAEGDLVGAEETLRELVSVGLLFTDDGSTLIVALIGAVIGGWGVDNLRLFYTLTGQLDKAASLQQPAALDAELELDSGTPTVARSLESVLRDPRVIRQLKSELVLRLLYQETCTSPRRLLSGPRAAVVEFVEGPLREELVRYPLEGQVYELMMNWEPTMARRHPAEGQMRSDLVGGLLHWSWHAARLTGYRRLAACISST